jgi:hypothetical protein
MAGVRTARQRSIAAAGAQGRPAPDADASFQRAILKIALELKKPTARSYDAVVEETIRSMRLDPDRFRQYLGANRAEGMGLLLAAARKFGP